MSDRKLANSHSMVCTTSLAFGIVGLVCCAFCKDVDKKMNKKVSTLLNVLSSMVRWFN